MPNQIIWIFLCLPLLSLAGQTNTPDVLRRHIGICSRALTSAAPTARCGHACGVVWKGSVR